MINLMHIDNKKLVLNDLKPFQKRRVFRICGRTAGFEHFKKEEYLEYMIELLVFSMFFI